MTSQSNVRSIIIFLGLVTFACGQTPILERGIQVLTFKSGTWTAARRVAPVRTMTCTGGSAAQRTDLHPSVVQCENKGMDDQGRVNWKCTAELHESVRFGAISVNCEGWTHPDDPYILPGSCGLEYELDLVPPAPTRAPIPDPAVSVPTKSCVTQNGLIFDCPLKVTPEGEPLRDPVRLASGLVVDRSSIPPPPPPRAIWISDDSWSLIRTFAMLLVVFIPIVVIVECLPAEVKSGASLLTLRR